MTTLAFDSAFLASKGVVLQGVTGFIPDGVSHSVRMAFDAQPALGTVSNSGIPAYLLNYIDPKVIDIIFAPMASAEIAGAEVKRGDMTTATTQFNMIEATGEATAYGDYSENGTSGANLNYVYRQAFNVQTMTNWGQIELEKAGEVKLDWASKINAASILTLNKWMNKNNFFGTAGLLNYGLLNDPSLPTAISPATKAAGGVLWSAATAEEILEDVSRLYKNIQGRANGVVELTSPMTLAMSPVAQANMTKTTQFNVNAFDMIKRNYPNLTIKVAPEYSTASGELVQLIVDEVQGQRTVECAFTEKLRAFPVIVGSSSFKQKKACGSWGAVIYRPALIGQMLGV